MMKPVVARSASGGNGPRGPRREAATVVPPPAVGRVVTTAVNPSGASASDTVEPGPSVAGAPKFVVRGRVAGLTRPHRPPGVPAPPPPRPPATPSPASPVPPPPTAAGGPG